MTREIYRHLSGRQFVRLAENGRRWFLAFGRIDGRLDDGSITERVMFRDSSDGWRLADTLGIERAKVQ